MSETKTKIRNRRRAFPLAELGITLQTSEATLRKLDELAIKQALAAERVRSCPMIFGTRRSPDGGRG